MKDAVLDLVVAARGVQRLIEEGPESDDADDIDLWREELGRCAAKLDTALEGLGGNVDA